ncbi:MAG: ATP-binding protein, partial [Bacteroidota bacterium]
MTLSLNVLNHLGLNLYSNIPSVLSEVVANSYDADATEVSIVITNNRIIIKDDGNGMDAAEINAKYLLVGYQKRLNGEAFSPVYNRPVMGRKGIGKLSLFSIANTIELHSHKNGKVSSLKMNKEEIKRQIKENNGTYFPEEIAPLPIEKGTTIIIYDLKKGVSKAKSLKKRLARRFSVIGEENKFLVKVNEEPISIADRDFFNKVEFLWLVDHDDKLYRRKFKNIKNFDSLNGRVLINEKEYLIEGWIGTVELPSQLSEDGTNNNKISIICRGKLAQEDILETYTEGGIYADYLIGEIKADFLDDDSEEDIATSSRQKINEDDPRFIAVKKVIYSYLKAIQSQWTQLRNDRATDKILGEFEAVKSWYEELKYDSHKKQAQKLFKTIDTLHFDKENIDEKKTLVRQAVLAFEQLKIRESLNQIDKIETTNDIELINVFGHLSEIEAMLYYDIASGRVKVIRELKEKTEKNELEAVLQKHIFDNLWLLNPSWERATQATEYMESKIGKAFEDVSDKLTDEQKRGRIDIGYRTAGGKHIIVELKRYKPSYKITPFVLAE